QLLEPLLRLVGAIELVEVDRHLDLGVAPQRRVLGQLLIDLERERRLLQVLVKIGEREQRERLLGIEIDGKLQVDEREVLAALAPERGAETVEQFGGAGLGRLDERRKLLAGLEAVDRLDDERMTRQHLLEGAKHLERLVLVLGAREPAAIGLNGANLVAVDGVRLLQPLAGVLAVAGEVENEAGMQILEGAIPLRPVETVDG